jgi:hypothetical protein
MIEICTLFGMDNVIKCAVVAGVATALVFSTALAQSMTTTIFLEAVLKPRSDDLCAKFVYKRRKIFCHIQLIWRKIFIHLEPNLAAKHPDHGFRTAS